MFYTEPLNLSNVWHSWDIPKNKISINKKIFPGNRNVLSHSPLIQCALSSYDARREFGEQERTVRIARGESRAALASLVLSKQNDVFE